MGIDAGLSVSTVLGFLLTLVRVSGVFAFVPVPGLRSAVDPARIVLILAVAIALFPVWPHPASNTSAGLFATWMLAEGALGVGIGLAVGFAVEAVMVGTQTIGLQAGFSFASTVDPSTQADSTVLVMLAQTMTAVLFFSMGLDRDVVRIFARSLEVCPPGSFLLSHNAVESVALAGATMFSTGLRLALPVLAVLIMVDISLALLGRVNSQLQLLTISFPVKIIIGLGLFAWIAVLLPAVLRGTANAGFQTIGALVRR